MGNYRPISLLSVFSKLLEKLMYNRLIDFIRKKSILYPKQFGFREQHSTDHALLSIVDKIQNSIDNREYSCGIFLDFSKAFDTVNHEILIQKLEHYGIRGVANDWFTSYLSGRTQVTVCGDSVSTKQSISCGQVLWSCLKDPCWVLYYFFCILMILVTVLVYLICIFLQTMPIYSSQIKNYLILNWS